MAATNYRRIVGLAKNGADRKEKIIHEWASGMVFFNPRDTRAALELIGSSVHSDITVALHEVFTTSEDYIEVKRMTGAAGMNGGELAIYLVLPVSQWHE